MLTKPMGSLSDVTRCGRSSTEPGQPIPSGAVTLNLGLVP